MRKSILHDLFYNNLSLWERTPTDNPERKANQRRIEEETDYFKQRMSQEDSERMVKLHNMLHLANGYDDYDAFCYGFRLGMQLIVEGVLVPVE